MIDPQPTPSRRGAGRRRGERRRRIDTSIPSPCVAVCSIDERSGFCLGCYRDIDEIRDWPILSAEEKQHVLERLAARKNAGE